MHGITITHSILLEKFSNKFKFKNKVTVKHNKSVQNLEFYQKIYKQVTEIFSNIVIKRNKINKTPKC